MYLGDVMGFVVPVASWELLMGSEECLEASQASPSSVLTSPSHSRSQRFWLAIKGTPRLLMALNQSSQRVVFHWELHLRTSDGLRWINSINCQRNSSLPNYIFSVCKSFHRCFPWQLSKWPFDFTMFGAFFIYDIDNHCVAVHHGGIGVLKNIEYFINMHV